ncbi:MAG: alpha/beta hydrolase [Myxococcota bacterium]
MELKRLTDPELDAHVAETRAFNAKIPKEGTPARWTPEAIAKARDLSQVMGGIFAGRTIEGFEERTIPGPAGPQRIRVFVPPEVRAVYLDIHGGGFFMGAPEMDDAANAALAKHAKVATVAAGYRLAPEHTYPAGPDDCEAAALWLLENARREFGTERLIIAGGSAGANLAAVTLLRLRDRHQSAERFAAANLVFGVYDLSGTPSQLQQGMTGFRDLYLPDHDTAARKNPDISPLYADLAGLPPALFTVGAADYLYDDSLFMAMRWRAAGNETALAVYPESVHGFTVFPTAMARAANRRIADFVAAHV